MEGNFRIDFSGELALANKAFATAWHLGKFKGNVRVTTGYCALAATWLASQINLNTPGRARVVIGHKAYCGHAWVVLDNDWVLDPTNEQFDAGEPVYFAPIEESIDYIDTLKNNISRWPFWQQPDEDNLKMFSEAVERYSSNPPSESSFLR